MTSVIGIDVGNLASKIGAARNRGIDILINEVSNRATPSLVAFGPRSRNIGESAKSQEMGNFKNTIGSLKRLIGRSLQDPDIQQYEAKYLNNELVDVKGSVGVKVNYLGEQTEFSATQLYGAYLGKLRDIAAKELKSAVNDVVIAVPGWYTDAQRRAVLDAAEIANLHTLRLINEPTAIALGYGITKTDLPPPEEKPKHIAFVDIGHSSYSVSIVAFSKGSLTVKGTAYDRHFGGRDIDWALVEHFAEEFKSKYKIDVKSNKKAVFRLASGVEKLKKILSANAAAPLSVESIMNDVDASSSMTREAFDEMIAPLLERTIAPLEAALAEAKISPDEIEAVELIGGSTRIPALKNRIQSFFGRPLSFTCNPEEAVCRGATLACAILSPVFKVRDFSTSDITGFPIDFTWARDAGDPDDDTTLRVIQKMEAVPSKVKALTYYRKQPFEIMASYPDVKDLPGVSSPFIGKISLQNVTPNSKGDFSQVKLKVKLNLHGILSVDSAALVEEVEVEAPAAEQKMDVDGGEVPAEGADAPPAKKSKKTIRKDIPFTFETSALPTHILNDMKQSEGEMHANDRLVSETEDRKNALEEYIYDMREKLDGSYSAFAPSADKDTLRSKLSEAEDWLYTEEGEDAKKSDYVSRLDALKKLGDPIAFRYREKEERDRAAKALGETLAGFMDKAQSGDEKYSHIEEKDMQKVIETVANAQKWMQDIMAKQSERPKDQDPVVTVKDLVKKREDVTFTCTPILSKPKPKTAEPTPTSTPPPKEEKKEEKPQNGDVDMDFAGAEGEKPDMDVD
ncbi:heat shock protein 70 [Atractiella rhizophila]|nr:heat shock protein 70 [Atractiella rhizophila]